LARYVQPTTLSDALALRATGSFRPLAGGTDFFPARVGHTIDEDVLDLSRLPNWREMRETRDALVVGAGVTWTQLREAQLPPWCNALALAASEIGGVQIQNRGTLVGNICNASPAADGVPVLLALDANVWWNDTNGAHETPLAQFILGPRKTVLTPTGLVTGLRIPKPANDARSHFIKTGARTYQLISTVMVAAQLEVVERTITSARVAVGAASAVAQRLHVLEQTLYGKQIGPALGECVTSAHVATLAPITDVRSDASYRRDAALTLTRRALNAIGSAAC
jgi:CO/xanthine dehydrogenase FAD-binding subunit